MPSRRAGLIRARSVQPTEQQTAIELQQDSQTIATRLVKMRAALVVLGVSVASASAQHGVRGPINGGPIISTLSPTTYAPTAPTLATTWRCLKQVVVESQLSDMESVSAGDCLAIPSRLKDQLGGAGSSFVGALPEGLLYFTPTGRRGGRQLSRGGLRARHPGVPAAGRRCRSDPTDLALGLVQLLCRHCGDECARGLRRRAHPFPHGRHPDRLVRPLGSWLRALCYPRRRDGPCASASETPSDRWKASAPASQSLLKLDVDAAAGTVRDSES
jgi:hypothetical protein